MLITTKQIELELGNHPAVLSVDRCKNKDFRIATTATFPNGEFYDIFLSQIEGCYLLHDQDQIAEYYRQCGKDLVKDAKTESLEFILNVLQVPFTASGLQLSGSKTSNIGKDIMRMVQAFQVFWDMNK